MKTQVKIFSLLVILLLTVKCKKDDENLSEKTGFLSLNVAMDITVQESGRGFKSTCAAGDLKVVIYSASGEEVLSFATADAMPSSVELKAGEYYVTAFSENSLPAAFENPVYSGRSANFTVSPGLTTNAEVTAKLVNCAVSIIFSENIKQHFSDYYAEISTANGILTYGKTETRKGYFEITPISIKATLTYSLNGETRTKVLTGSIAPDEGKHYEVVLNANISNGLSAINVLLDETEVYRNAEHFGRTRFNHRWFVDHRDYV
ncbi:MAG: DUF4493 domain-containing protein [Bacteroidales bacterium]|nr:DUF4493 domain-containing protein [Bacteroidales bacterium]